MKSVMKSFSVLLLAATFSNAAMAGWDEVTASFDKKDYETTLKELLPLTEQGDAQAMFYVATLYNQKGLLKLDPVEATKWYRMAANGGHPESARIMGYRYLNALGGVEKNTAEGIKWLRKAIELGDKAANTPFKLGVIYHLAEGVEKDDNESAKWFRMARDMGHPRAEEALNGLGK